MESTLYHSNIYASTGAPSPYMAPTFAEQHQLPPLPHYRHNNNNNTTTTMFGTPTTPTTTNTTTTTSTNSHSPPYYTSSPYHQYPYNNAAGHGAEYGSSGADPYVPGWSSSPFMSPPTSLPPPPNSFRGTARYPPPPHHHHHHHHPTTGFPGAPCSPPDTTGTAPIQRPKLTTTVWEDEGTLCYQVDAKNICVARRQDNDMVNGTKLLNVVGMSRGKRDGILKNEKGRVVVKVGAMHLKGVWITFSRAKDLATKFKILELLYPLFTDDPSMFLCTSSSSVNGTATTTINNDSHTSSSSNSSNTSHHGLPLTTSDTASVETAQTSSTVKSLAHTSTHLPPPMPYKTDSYNMMPSWMDQRPYQSSLPSIHNNPNENHVYRSQNCSPVPSAVAPGCSTEDSYGMFHQPEYDYRSISRTLACQSEFSSPAYDDNTFLSHKPDMFATEETTVTTTTTPPTTTMAYPSSLPSVDGCLDDLSIPQQPTSIYDPRNHELDHVVGSPDENDTSNFAVTATTTTATTVVSEDGSSAIVPDSILMDSSRKRKMEDDDDNEEYINHKESNHGVKRIKNEN